MPNKQPSEFAEGTSLGVHVGRPKKQPLLTRAAISLLLIVGFYTSGLVLIATTGFIVFELIIHRVGGTAVRLIALPIVGICVAIAKGMASLFASHPWRAPLGIEATRDSQPQLAAFVHDLAVEMKTEPPAHIYLTHDVNAAVTQTKGGLFSGSAPRVMIIGVPLLQTLTQGELRSVLAHEFGHFIGGDTKLGAMTYKSHASMRRTLQSLDGGVYRAFLIWYARQATKVSLAVRRNQELESDFTSIRLNGSLAHATALEKVELTSAAFDEVMGSYVDPVWRTDQQPENIFEALRYFLASPERMKRLDEIRVALHEQQSDPYDSHPSLHERVQYAQTLNVTIEPLSGASAPARQLLVNPEMLEREMTDVLSVAVLGHEPKAKISWANAGEEAFGRLTLTPARALALATAEVDGRQGPITIQRVLEAMHRKQTLPITIAIAGPIDYVNEESRQEAAEEFLFGHLEALVALALRDQGYRYMISWDGPLQLISPSAVVVDIKEPVEQAVKGNVQPLVELVSRAGVQVNWQLPERSDDEYSIEVGIDRAVGAIPNAHVERTFADALIRGTRVSEIYVANDAVFVIDTGTKRPREHGFFAKKAKERDAKAVRDRAEALFAMTPEQVRNLPNATRYDLTAIKDCKLTGDASEWSLRLNLMDGSSLKIRPHTNLRASIQHVYDCISPVLGSRLVV